ncbi:MAG: hypothetical protein LUQ31_03040 [Methanoregula sp.]|nr:hypothetical protein [Methanoregula sp.]
MVLVVDDLLNLPIDLSMKVLQAIADDADAATLNSEKSVRTKVLETQMKYERGDMPEEEYKASMSLLRKRLDEVKGV